MEDLEDEYETLKLGNQLCFPLYACAKEIIRQYTPMLETVGLTYTQYITMMVLWEHNGMRSKQIGELLYLDSGTLTPVLRRLEEKGWITRCRAKDDERNLWVCVTEEGYALRDRVKDIPLEVSDQIQLDQEEAVELHRLLYRLLNKMR